MFWSVHGRTDEDTQHASGGCLQGAVPARVVLAAAKQAAVRGLVVEGLERGAISARCTVEVSLVQVDVSHAPCMLLPCVP